MDTTEAAEAIGQDRRWLSQGRRNYERCLASRPKGAAHAQEMRYA